MKKIISILAAAAVATIGSAGVASATTSVKPKKPPRCVVAHDTITKTDNGHGSPSEWADLVLYRRTTVCWDKSDQTWTITLRDNGRLWTREGAGSPNGTPGVQIAHRVRGAVSGTYHLTATGGDGNTWHVRRHGDAGASGSTAYVQSLFKDEGSTVTGGSYSWYYRTVCGEHWLDASTNNDGQGAQAGNITGKWCHACGKPHHHKPAPKPTTPLPTPAQPGGDDSSTPKTPGEAPKPKPVTYDLPVTG